MSYTICKSIIIGKNAVKFNCTSNNVWSVNPKTGREYREFRVIESDYFNNMLLKYGKSVVIGIILSDYLDGSMQGGSHVYAKYIPTKEVAERYDQLSLEKYNTNDKEKIEIEIANLLYNDFANQSVKMNKVIMMENGAYIKKIKKNTIQVTKDIRLAQRFLSGIELNYVSKILQTSYSRYGYSVIGTDLK